MHGPTGKVRLFARDFHSRNKPCLLRAIFSIRPALLAFNMARPMKIKKRSGAEQELDLNKIHAVLEWACKGNHELSPVKGVSVSEIEMRAHLQFYEGMTTKAIHECLINSAASLISEDTPNYDQVAARLRWFAVRKEAFGENKPPALFPVIKANCERGMYDPEVLGMYTEAEWNEIDSFIDHTRDDLFRYAGAEQMHKKYLVQNRATKQIFETFQIAYIMVAAVLFHKYPKAKRLQYVRRFYDAVSMHHISLPTPVMAGVRTPEKQFASCTKIDVGDSLDSITSAATAIVDYASRKAGIGLNIGRLRALGQPVRNGKAVTTGILPFAKLFAAALKSCSQGGLRGASATFNYPLWHLEFKTLIELKNSKGVEETRLRTVDYCVHLNKTMYERLVQKKNITFFSPDEVPDLYEAFYGPADVFKKLYEHYEKDATKRKMTMPATAVFALLAQQRFETSRIYIMHADHMNTHSPFYEPITMTNLCVEIGLPTQPILEHGEAGRVALCILGALNWGKLKSDKDFQEASELVVRALDELIDYQDYPNGAAKAATMEYRPLGVGVIGFAHWMAKHGFSWSNAATDPQVYAQMETMAYFMTKASIDLAKEKGACPKRTKYHDGILPIDTAVKLGFKPTRDWDALRAEAKRYGIRNATLMAGMPSETSSQLANETNGFEPPKDLITIKGSKDGAPPQVVPEFFKLGYAYETTWNVPASAYLRVISIIQQFVDQSISANTTYVPPKEGEFTTSVLIQDLLTAYSRGVKTLYYNNVLDGASESVDDGAGCESGACKL